jgi:hypothetical protein
VKKALMIVALVAIIAIAGSLIYYFIFFKPTQQKAEIRLQEQKLEMEKDKQRADEIRIENDKKDKELQELNKEQQELDKKAQLSIALADIDKWYNEALDEARKVYHEDWDLNCKNRGLAPGSPLPSDIAKGLDDRFHESIVIINKNYEMKKDEIYKLYN